MGRIRKPTSHHDLTALSMCILCAARRVRLGIRSLDPLIDIQIPHAAVHHLVPVMRDGSDARLRHL